MLQQDEKVPPYDESCWAESCVYLPFAGVKTADEGVAAGEAAATIISKFPWHMAI
ncbi:MAG: hypothetical protein NVS9B15_06460 [Acidobacteriaceae bacterium]